MGVCSSHAWKSARCAGPAGGQGQLGAAGVAGVAGVAHVTGEGLHERSGLALPDPVGPGVGAANVARRRGARHRQDRGTNLRERLGSRNRCFDREIELDRDGGIEVDPRLLRDEEDRSAYRTGRSTRYLAPSGSSTSRLPGAVISSARSPRGRAIGVTRATGSARAASMVCLSSLASRVWPLRVSCAAIWAATA